MTGSGDTVTGSSVTHGLTGGIPAWFPLQPGSGHTVSPTVTGSGHTVHLTVTMVLVIQCICDWF